MAKITYNICVLIVTYSNRWQFLEQVLRRVVTLENVTDVIIIDNASVYSVEEHCTSFRDDRIKVLTQTENRGSAGGYKVGLEFFMEKTQADFVWLLDDDNLPNPDALLKLIEAWTTLKGPNDKKALFSLRPDRKQHVQIAKGENSNRFFLVKNSFMGFHLFRIPINRFYKFQNKFIKRGDLKERAIMPYAPYGGMFFHRQMIGLIGYPDESFFVYADDSEYTYRITQTGGKIWLIPASNITDIDNSFSVGYVSHFWRSIYLDLWSFRTYYLMRNSVYFFAKYNVSSHTIYSLNKFLFLFGQWVISKLTAKQENYKKLLTAVDDGTRGNLGIRP